MEPPIKHDFTIIQGDTLRHVMYWYDGSPVTKPISAITLGFPPVITATGHGLPSDKIPVTLSGIKGPAQLNNTGYALQLSADTFSLPDIDASLLKAYVGGGYVRYTAPKDLTGYSARMQIRLTIDDTTVVLELTTVNNRIVLGGAEGSVSLILTDTDTAALDFENAVYDLELISSIGEVTKLVRGTVTLEREVTR